MRGRKPTPTNLKLIRGNPGKRAINKDEPIPEGELDTPPDWLSDSQKAGWRYVIEHSPKGMLKKIDRSALVVWVVAEDLHRQASEKVEKFGLLTKTPKTGDPMQSPYLPIVNKQALIMLKAATELGFTPVSRPRISVGQGGRTRNPFSDI